MSGTGRITGAALNLRDVPELVTTVAALATVADRPSTISGVGHVRGHETDRLAALADELNALGAIVLESEDGLQITPRPLRGGTFHTYADHRLATAAAVLGLVVPGIEVVDIATTSKTLPDFPALWSAMLAGQAT
jgi:3-phosphoshikimate 1-carboxyvinyltransferase